MAKKGLIGEFKDFISKGNALSMAIGVIVGGAFTGIVTSLTENIINPVIGMFGGANFDAYSVNLLGEATLYYGKFLTTVVNFLITMFVLFLIVKGINKMQDEALKRLHHGKEEESVPTTKKCPFCCSEIPIEATRCAHCTSEFVVEAVEEA